VAATSARNAWAVGEAGHNQTLILHWNGTAWERAPSLSPAPGTTLLGAAAVSARDAWAVGNTGDSAISGTSTTVIEHWNGAGWR
jgi:hypothetical protein